MSEKKATVPTERKGLMLCCMRTAERYGDAHGHSTITKGTIIICDRCGQQIEAISGRAWKAH